MGRFDSSGALCVVKLFDPPTGRCTSISTQYRIRVAPAFVVNPQAQDANKPLALR